MDANRGERQSETEEPPESGEPVEERKFMARQVSDAKRPANPRLRKPSTEYREAFTSLELMSAVASARLRAGYTPTADELRAEEAAFDRLLHARQAYWQSVSKREV